MLRRGTVAAAVLSLALPVGCAAVPAARDTRLPAATPGATTTPASAATGALEGEPTEPATAPEPDPPARRPTGPTGAHDPPSQAPEHGPTVVGDFGVDAVPEASGLGASRRIPGVLYILDDGPGTSEIWVVRPGSAPLGAMQIAGLRGRDTESLTVAACGSDSEQWCVYVGDIGDNPRVRETVQVWRLPEPDLSAGIPEQPFAADAITLRYPDGPHDAEALLVDGAGVPHLVTKDAGVGADGRPGLGAARLYAAPGFADGVMSDLGAVPLPAPAEPLAAAFVGVVVTGGDALPGRVLLRTYDHIVELTAPSADAPLADMAAWPARELPSPREPQGEAVAYAADGCGLYTVGEQVGTIWFVPLPEAPGCLP
jgi:hypothetical protein